MFYSNQFLENKLSSKNLCIPENNFFDQLTPESKKRHYDKYIEIGTALADRIKDKLINEKDVRIEKSGGKLLHSVPEWFGKIEFISSLTFGAAEIQRNRLEILHLFSLYKKTTIQRNYADSKSGKIKVK